MDQLNLVDIKFDGEIQALLILDQLPKSWKGIATSISSSSRKLKFEFLEVMYMIMIEEIKKHEKGFSNSGSTLNMESRGINQNKGNGRSKSRSTNNRSKSRNSKNSQKNKKDIECWNCGKNGHYKNECKNPKKDKDGYNKTNANTVLE